MTTNSRTKLLVSGAAGHLGRRVVEILLEHVDPARIVAGTRDPTALADVAARGVTVRRVDFDDGASLETALSDVERFYLISTDKMIPGARFAQHRAAIDAAKRAGVPHVVYSSAPRPERGGPVWILDDHFDTEEHLAQSGLVWTALRNNLYTEVLLGSLKPALAHGVLHTASVGGAPWVTRDDCARVAAAVLISGEARGPVEITGPSAPTYAEIAAAASAIAGKPLVNKVLTPDDYVALLGQAGIPEPVGRLYAAFDTAMAEGKFGGPTDAVARLTGRAPTTVADFLRTAL
jgi:NAD(P)H dehydrogenase (quinone)